MDDKAVDIFQLSGDTRYLYAQYFHFNNVMVRSNEVHRFKLIAGTNESSPETSKRIPFGEVTNITNLNLAKPTVTVTVRGIYPVGRSAYPYLMVDRQNQQTVAIFEGSGTYEYNVDLKGLKVHTFEIRLNTNTGVLSNFTRVYVGPRDMVLHLNLIGTTSSQYPYDP